jgi:hypothetical protein
MDEDLARFVVRAHERGMDLDGVAALLAEAGWSREEVVRAWCERVLDRPVPVPAPGRTAAAGRPPLSARDTFWHVLGFGTLYTWVISLVVLLFQYVNLALPDPAWGDPGSARAFTYSGIRWGLATILVAYPVFLWTWRRVLREVEVHPEKLRVPARRWLTWLSLLVGAATLLADVITLLYHLFEGEVTLRFLLKVLALFVVTGGVLLYLGATLRQASEPLAAREEAP